MEKYLKSLKPTIQDKLLEKFAPDEAALKWDEIVKLEEKWIREEGDLGGRSNPMSPFMMLCYAMCAYYEVVGRDVSDEEFFSMACKAKESGFRLMRKFDMNSLEKKPWLMKTAYRLMEKYKKKADAKRGSEWGNTWRLRINPEGRAVGIAYSLDSCPLWDFARKHGYEDYVRNFCAMDPYVAEQFHSKLIRHNILSHGDPRCDYWYVGDKSEEALSDKGSK